MKKGLIVFCVCFLFTLVTAAWYLKSGPAVFPLDDTYIHFVYADSIAGGDGLSFNRGETSFGTSSPLWTALLALCALPGADLYAAALALAVCFHCCSALLIYYICGALTAPDRKNAAGVVGALVYLAAGNMTWLALSGMETPLFHMLCLACILLFIKKGYSAPTAAVAGALLLCRITGLFLVVVLMFAELLQTRKRVPWMLSTIGIPLPWYGYHFLVTGGFLPVTARGKLLTYVDGGWDPERILSFYLAILKYLFFYEPVFLVLGCTFIAGCASLMRSDRTAPGMRRTGIWIVAAWLMLHLVVHGLLFRSLNQQMRYLGVLFPALSIVGTCLLFRILRNKRACIVVCGLLIAGCLCNQVRWRSWYHQNTDHMQRVYLDCARWIAENTDDSVIAAFDIGFIKYITGRYVVDLGGVTGDEVHPYLIRHDSGRLLRKKGATLVVYSRRPDCDVWNGIYRAAYDRQGLLQETGLASFGIDMYPTPSVTHSFQLDVRRIVAWVDPHSGAARALFTDAQGGSREAASLGNGLGLVAFAAEKSEIFVVPNMAQALQVSYRWRVLQDVAAGTTVKTWIAHADSQQRIFDKVHIPTHGVVPLDTWTPGRGIRETHLLWIPDTAPPGRYNVFVAANEPEAREIKAGEIFLKKASFINEY